MKIILITLTTLFIVWSIVFNIKLDRTVEEVVDFTSTINEDIMVSKDDDLKLSVYYFKTCNVKTLEEIFMKIELKNSYGNRVNLILFKEEKKALIVADAYIEDRLGELSMDYYEKRLIEGIGSNQESDAIQDVVSAMESSFGRFMKLDIKKHHIINELRFSKPNMNRLTNMAGILDKIAYNLN